MDLADQLGKKKGKKKPAEKKQQRQKDPAEYFNAPDQASILLEEPPKKKKQPKQDGFGKIIGLFGMQGTGKTYRACCFAKFGKILYLDGERKAHEVINEKFPDFKKDIEIKVFQKLKKNYMIDELGTVLEFLKNLPQYIKKIESGKYKTVVVDNCSVFKAFGKAKWFRDNPKRNRPQPYEYGEIEKTIQECLMPIINACKINDVNLILCYSIIDFYIKDVVMGTKEDAKSWVLGQLSYELWLERDYKVYCLKHPYKPYWEFQDQDLFLGDYLFDNNFIDEDVDFKEYILFKEETLESQSQRQRRKEARKQSQLSLG